MKLKVEKTTQTTTGQFLNKLVGEHKVTTPLGDIVQKKTYYLFTQQDNPIGTEVEWDIEHDENVEIVPLERTFKDSDGKEMTATLKYIFPKKG